MRIGNAVVLSRNVVVRSGVSIGDGAVIGANSLVTRDIPPYAIAAGAPAKVVRMRFSDEIISELMDLRWWDLEIPWIFKNTEILSEINVVSFINRIKSVKPPYRSDSCRFVLDASATSDGKRSFKVIGVDDLGKFFAIQDCPEKIRRYVSQLALPSGEKINFVKNIFNAD